MRATLRRRGAMAAVVAALSAGGMLLTTASASATASAPASANASALLTVEVGAAIFNGRSLASGEVGIPDLWSGDVLLATCWNTGENLGRGNRWYFTVYERYSRFNGLELTASGWTYAPYVDNSAASKSVITHC
ncbi:hypothetical protein [Streptomyces sp. NBC_00878]|uniref:hypothetical protein n=1 Tax=Streptomyces sp. NBC_00878 TaxID=2975854 RepID=UPI0022568676|nr:hypothetical protein [Streptomyces sp. NBC_00878]MCX4911132.1 hypothetical protein [Streptomyces sp. NBC_00878]